ncbi:MAG TPA: VWA domain-containing protein [Candidatus Woesearchaeota archaeon]|nr:VWA domain-containing protein [Candidatus Woesearchaeota archaeon]
MQLANTLGLYAFLSLIPLVIIYLRKPKPVEKIIPSLMFLIKNQKDATKHSFFQKLLRNLVFLLQLLALSLMAFSIASPYIITSEAVTSQNTVIIVDASASSQTINNGKTRFENSLDIAKDYLQGKISIIVASDTTETILEDGTRNQALSLIQTIEPKDTKTNLEGALYEAESLLEDKKGRVVVISDFIVNDLNELLKAKRILSSKSIDVKFISTWNKAKNIGIINLNIDKYNTVAYVKNFNDDDAEIITALVKDGSALETKSKKITAHSTEVFNFETPTGISEIKINSDDDFKLDNTAYISAPLKKQIDVLLITNAKTSYLMKALQSSKDINLKITEPPIVQGVNSNEIIIINDVNGNLILPGTLEEISREVGNGKDLIITAQSDLNQIGISWLLPVELNEKINNTKACVKVVNEFTKQFENNRCFTTVTKYFKTIPKNNAISIIEADDSSPLVALGKRGKGSIVYYGLIDEESDFKTQTSYPIFWNELLNFLAETGDIKDYNFRIDEKPSINKAGIYDNGNKIAVNLLDEDESDISRETMSFDEDEFVSGISQENIVLNLDIYLIIFAIIIMFFEIFYIKIRGDL